MSDTPLFMHVFASFGRGGVPLRIAGYLNWLGAAARHVIVALDGDIGAGEDLSADLAVSYLTEPARGGLLSRLRSIRQELRHREPDLLLSYNWGSIEWPLANRLSPFCPHIHFESGFGKEEADGQIWRRVLLRRVALARSAALIVPSAKLADIAHDQWKFPPDRLHRILNGVDAQRFAAAPDPELIPALGSEPHGLVIGTVAPLRPEKNLYRLIRAFRKVREEIRGARLVVVGDGGERTGLEAFAVELGLSDGVIFTGHISAPEKVYGLFDVFAMSSDTEQMPNVVLQAMAAGLPIVATDVGDIATMVASANRNLIVPKGDEAALALAMTNLLRHGERARDIGELNRTRARADFDLERMYVAYRDLMGKVVPCMS